MQSTVHTTTQATPMQLVFRRDAIMNVTFYANWNLIKQPKQQSINQRNAKENSKRIPHTYKVDDLVIIKMNSHLNMAKMLIMALGQSRKYKKTDR